MDLRDIFVDKLKIESKVTAIDSIFGNEDRVRRTIYNPPYQRNYVWDTEKASYFLESILIGTEVPPLIFFRKVGSLEIIDGRQRYETILRFMNSSLRLNKKGLKKLDNIGIENKSFKDLPEDMKNDFLETKIRIIEFSLPSAYSDMEDAVKQEIFKRYNSGITPLKPTDIDRAIYLEDDLNNYFKSKLHENKLMGLFQDLFFYENKNDEVLLKEIRQLLVLHKIPIKYYSVAKQKILKKYYSLLADKITDNEFGELYDRFHLKLDIIKHIKQILEGRGIPYNRLYSECLFWGLSILDENIPNIISNFEEIDYISISNELIKSKDFFKTERSSFSKTLVDRYKVIADFFQSVYSVDFKNYIYNNDTFRNSNNATDNNKKSEVPNLSELRINKPEPSTNTIEDICRQMGRNRFLIRPPYQREEVINHSKSSEIIESLLLGIKLPPIFIYRRNDGICEVIDGQQRLLSILAFIGKGYMNEKGEIVKSKKDGFALYLKDSILSNLHKQRFEDLDEESKEKILNFDLWTIEIQEKYNPEFEAIDLFVRLNNKPYPIKDDTFEMWNSYIDRDIIETIKLTKINNESWFYLRKKSARMENENLYSVLSFFEYQQKAGINVKSSIDAIDIYKTLSKINFRLRSKSALSKVLENQQEKKNFINAINSFEFGFLPKLRTLLSTDNNIDETSLVKSLDDLMLVENGKRTQQAFYALWYFLSPISMSAISSEKSNIKKDIKLLFKTMSTDIEITDFNDMFVKMVNKYKQEGQTPLIAKFCDLVSLTVVNESTNIENQDLFINSNSRAYSRIQVSDTLSDITCNSVFVIRPHRPYVSINYIKHLLRSAFVYRQIEAADKEISITKIKNLAVPVPTMAQMNEFDKIEEYQKLGNDECNRFFSEVADRLIEELYLVEEFEKQHFSLFSTLQRLSIPTSKEDANRTFLDVSSSGSYLLSDLTIASGITYGYHNKYEKN
jgi:hypothetical protein